MWTPLQQFKAKNICAAINTSNINSMKVWQVEQSKDPLQEINKIDPQYLTKRGFQA